MNAGEPLKHTQESQISWWKTGHVCDPGLGNEDNFRLNCTWEGGVEVQILKVTFMARLEKGKKQKQKNPTSSKVYRDILRYSIGKWATGRRDWAVETQ